MISQLVTRHSRPARLIVVPKMPESQTQLLLHEAKTQYKVESARSIPELLPGEILVEVHAIGLNPIDWKSALVNLSQRRSSPPNLSLVSMGLHCRRSPV